MANTWTTKDGKTLKLRDMETSHIENCIRMLERFLATKPDPYAYGEPDNDTMAYDAFMSEVRHNDQLEEDAIEQIAKFKQELKRRK